MYSLLELSLGGYVRSSINHSMTSWLKLLVYEWSSLIRRRFPTEWEARQVQRSAVVYLLDASTHHPSEITSRNVCVWQVCLLFFESTSSGRLTKRPLDACTNSNNLLVDPSLVAGLPLIIRKISHWALWRAVLLAELSTCSFPFLPYILKKQTCCRLFLFLKLR